MSVLSHSGVMQSTTKCMHAASLCVTCGQYSSPVRYTKPRKERFSELSSLWRSSLPPSSCVEELLAAGAAVDSVAADGQTSLFVACEAGWLDCARALLDAGADRSLTTTVRLTLTLLQC